MLFVAADVRVWMKNFLFGNRLTLTGLKMTTFRIKTCDFLLNITVLQITILFCLQLLQSKLMSLIDLLYTL
jgi:hypothetical protein